MNINWPNRITFIRIFLIPVFVMSLSYNYIKTAFVLFIIGGATDAIDGLLARLLNQKTKIGAYLDPLADKGLVISAFYGLCNIGVIPAWLTILVISRDVIIIGGVILLNIIKANIVIKPTIMSKLTTCSQFLTIFAAFIFLFRGEGLIEPVFDVACVITGLLTFVSGFQYICKGISIFNMEGSNFNGSFSE